MGEGPFGFDRPGTAGDDGWFGLERPLVGAASGVTFRIKPDSAIEYVMGTGNIETVQNLRDEMSQVRREIRNKQEKAQRMEDSFLEDFSITRRRIDNVNDEIEMLMQEELELSDRINEILSDPLSHVSPREIQEDFAFRLREDLADQPISKGPFVDFKGDSYEVTMTVANLSQGDISDIENELQSLGLVVNSKEFFET